MFTYNRVNVWNKYFSEIHVYSSWLDVFKKLLMVFFIVVTYGIAAFFEILFYYRKVK